MLTRENWYQRKAWQVPRCLIAIFITLPEVLRLPALPRNGHLNVEVDLNRKDLVSRGTRENTLGFEPDQSSEMFPSNLLGKRLTQIPPDSWPIPKRQIKSPETVINS